MINDKIQNILSLTKQLFQPVINFTESCIGSILDLTISFLNSLLAFDIEAWANNSLEGLVWAGFWGFIAFTILKITMDCREAKENGEYEKYLAEKELY